MTVQFVFHIGGTLLSLSSLPHFFAYYFSYKFTDLSLSSCFPQLSTSEELVPLYKAKAVRTMQKFNEIYVVLL